MSEDSKSNREKVYTAQGSVLFAKAYNCSPPRPETPHTLSIFLSAFTAKETIWKSPESQFNKNKICSNGKTLYVVGDVCGPGSRECLMFSSESWVFKRMWAKIEKYVEAAGVCVEETEVICEGCVKDKENGKEVVVEVEEEESETGRKRRERGGRRRRRRRNDKMMRAMKVQFTNDPMSCVWFTESGIAHGSPSVSIQSTTTTAATTTTNTSTNCSGRHISTSATRTTTSITTTAISNHRLLAKLH